MLSHISLSNTLVSNAIKQPVSADIIDIPRDFLTRLFAALGLEIGKNSEQRYADATEHLNRFITDSKLLLNFWTGNDNGGMDAEDVGTIRARIKQSITALQNFAPPSNITTLNKIFLELTKVIEEAEKNTGNAVTASLQDTDQEIDNSVRGEHDVFKIDFDEEFEKPMPLQDHIRSMLDIDD